MAGSPRCPSARPRSTTSSAARPSAPPDERHLGADLGLYSVTFNNDVDLDRRTLEAYKAFRLEAEAKGFRHFLEVFDPNAARASAGRPGAVHQRPHCAHPGRRDQPRPAAVPKIVYHGPAAMEALARYDRSLVVGILGGSAGTTFDAFQMLWEAKKYGAGWPSTAARSTTPSTN